MGDVVRIESAEVRFFESMPQLKSTASTRVKPDPDVRRGEYLRKWWAENGDAYFGQLYLDGSVQLVPLKEAHERVSAAHKETRATRSLG